MEKLLKSLPLRLPQKDPKIEKVLPFEISRVRVRPPVIPQRKRGYDDKGTLRTETKPDLIPSVTVDQLEAKEDIFDLLLRQTDGVVRQLQSDPKKK
jgi:hypothetical protein